MSDAIRELIRDVPDFPKEGILYRDITPLLGSASGLAQCADLMLKPFLQGAIDGVAGIESRGFIFGTLIAQKLGVGFIPIRKPGKLPCETLQASYELEYGSDTVEMHRDAVQPGRRILIVDDLIATGGTLEAAIQLVKAAGGEVAGCSTAIELEFLKGRARLSEAQVESVLRY